MSIFLLIYHQLLSQLKGVNLNGFCSNSGDKYVVVDDETGQLVQDQDKNRDDWMPDDRIENPFD